MEAMWNITQVLGLLVQLLTLDYPLSTLQRGDEASTEYRENDLLRMLRCLYSPRRRGLVCDEWLYQPCVYGPDVR